MINNAIDFVINPKLLDKVPADVQQKVRDLAADIKSQKIVVPKDKF